MNMIAQQRPDGFDLGQTGATAAASPQGEAEEGAGLIYIKPRHPGPCNNLHGYGDSPDSSHAPAGGTASDRRSGRPRKRRAEYVSPNTGAAGRQHHGQSRPGRSDQAREEPSRDPDPAARRGRKRPHAERRGRPGHDRRVAGIATRGRPEDTREGGGKSPQASRQDAFGPRREYARRRR